MVTVYFPKVDLGGFCICYSVKHFTYFDTNIVTIPINSTLDPFFAFNSQTITDLQHLDI